MSIFNNEDGTTSLSRGEHYEVSGYVTIKILVRYDTKNEPGEDKDDLFDAIADDIGHKDFDIVDSDDLEYEIEGDDL